MLSPSTNFTTQNSASSKTPLHVLEFDGLSAKICDHKPSDADSNYYQYIMSITGLEQSLIPEKGKASIGSLEVTLIDKNNHVSSLISSDASFFHRKKVTLKSGYLSNAYADLLQEFTGWITGMKRGSDGVSWVLSVTDPQKWLQKTIFRNATEDVPYVFFGNPINILLSILTSSDAGTNGDYDLGDSDKGCGLDSNSVNIDLIERVRGDRFWGQTHDVLFEVTGKQKAKDFIETEILQLLNCYPQIDGSGKYFIIPFSPPIATKVVQSFTDQNVISKKLPSLDMNLKSMVNEIDFYLDYDSDLNDYLSIYYYVDSASFNSRGPSADPLEIKSKGLKTDFGTFSTPSHALEIINRRQASVFSRLAVPPIQISCDAFFSQRITEAGDIVPFSHSRMINVETGTLGITEKRMEVIKKKIDRKSGKVSLTFLDTGFDKSTYSALSPYMTVVSASSGTAFVVSVADALLFQEGWEAKIVDPYMNIKASNITILTINTSTGAVTCDDIGVTPTAGWHVIFEDYDSATADQQKYAFMSDISGYLGTSNDDQHLLTA